MSIKIQFQILSTLLILLVTSGVFFAQNQPNFFAARAYEGGIGYDVGDLNRDGKSDIVIAKADRLNLLTGNGSGFYNEASQTIYMCERFSSNAFRQPLIGDFNGDGNPDVAAWSEDNTCTGLGGRGLLLLAGNGTGGFSAPIFVAVSSFFHSPDRFLTADFNGDGRMDVAVSSSFSSTDGDRVGVFFGNNSGFAQPVVYNFGGSIAFGLVAGDFNNDNRPDLIFLRNSGSNIMILPNNGDGSFGVPQTISTNQTINGGISTGDFNGDGNLDFTTLHVTSASISVRFWQGNGNNTFAAGPTTNINFNSFGFGNHLSGDFNRDGRLDLALVISERLLILEGGGNGAFTEKAIYNIGSGYFFKGDFNNDGWLDLATQQRPNSSSLGSEFAILMNLQNGEFVTAPSALIPVLGNEMAIADFNRDGLKDIALTGDSFNGEILLILQDPAARAKKIVSAPKFKPSISDGTFLSGGGSLVPQTIAAGDFNGDGNPDVVVAGRAVSGSPDNVLITLGNGAGDLSLAATINLGGSVKKVIVCDLNRDNVLDLAFAVNRDTSSNTVPAVAVAFGLGNGTFSQPVGYLNNLPGESISEGDFNGDGNLDLAVALNNSKITILNNNGNGSFSVGSSVDVPAPPTEIVSVDLHGDGRSDLLVANNFGYLADTAKISVYTGFGNGTFAPPINYKTVGFANQRLLVEDFNGDSQPDVAVANGSVVTLFKNNGNGILTGKYLWGVGSGIRDLAASDFNNDGKHDLVATAVLFNLPNLSILPNISSPATANPTFSDYDGDGRADVSVFRPSNGSWYLNRSANGFAATAFGVASDKIVPADYDGDGKTDLAVFRDGNWYYLKSSDGAFAAVSFGQAGDIPVSGDFDGDGRSDQAVYRNGVWYLSRSTLGFAFVQFGVAGDKPVAADYDGDGRADIAVYRDGNWYSLRSSDGQFAAISFGVGTDLAVPADYDGDGRADQAVYRNGVWYLNRSTAGFAGIAFGVATDIPVAADYDGDGRADTAVYRDGNWYILQSTAGFTAQFFGQSGDKPTPSAFIY